MPIKSYEQIEQEIIRDILTVNPFIDVKIGSVVRDIYVGPQASQLQDIFSAADYSSRASSTLFASGDQLDRLAHNLNEQRQLPLRSTGTITLVIRNGVTTPTLLNVGDQFYTKPDQFGQIYTYILVQTTLLYPGQTQATVPIAALSPGASSNVPARAITEHNYNFVDAVYNADPIKDGKDREDDIAFAARIPYALTGLYNNTFKGATKILFNSQYSNTPIPYFVTPDNPLSRGPYTTDVYVQRNSTYLGTPENEVVPANTRLYTFINQPLYELNPISQITVLNPATGAITPYSQTINGIQQFAVINNAFDVGGKYVGTTKAGQQLRWADGITPPQYPYTVYYTSDHSVIDAQTEFDKVNEITNDLLYKQAKAIPVWVGASLTTRANSSPSIATQNATNNINNLFQNLSLVDAISAKRVEYAFLLDSQVIDLNLTNLDTTYAVKLNASVSNSGIVLQTAAQNLTLPYGVYYENNAVSPVTGFNIAGRLWIGNPDYITATGVNFNLPTNKSGVGSSTTIQNITTSWRTNIDTFYDPRTQTVVYNFTATPASINDSLSFNIVQPNITGVVGQTYVTLAPSLVTPIYVFPTTAELPTPTYGAVCPANLDPNRCNVYKNNLRLTPSANGIVGDYSILPADQNGIYSITFTVNPLPSDSLTFGLVNPDITVNSL